MTDFYPRNMYFCFDCGLYLEKPDVTSHLRSTPPHTVEVVAVLRAD